MFNPRRAMFGVALVGAAVVSLCATASADGMPERSYAPVYSPSYGWGGIYVGAQVGRSWADWNTNNFNNTLGFPTFTEDFSLSGWSYGGQVGIQHQVGPWVFGAEFALVGTDLFKSHGGPFNATQRDELGLDKIGMLTGRLGYSFSNMLLYGKAGYAYGSTRWDRVNTGFYEQVDSRHDGYVVGGGIDWRLHKNVTLGIDYSFVRLDATTNQGPISIGGPGVYEVTTKGDVQTIALRLNYLFGREPDYRPMK